MEKELKSLFFEIVLLTLLIIIVVPVCVNASDKYKEQRQVLFSGLGTSVDIINDGDMKKVTIYSNYNDVVKVNLIMKINKFFNDYDVYLDGNIYNIDDFEYIEDDEYRYYKLGIYEVDNIREFAFKLQVSGDIYYDETIFYSFMTEGLLW